MIHTSPSAQQIVTCARGWVGTRFLHQGRLKQTSNRKGGVDCLGLLIGVAAELKLTDTQGRTLASYDDTCYTHTPDTHTLRELLQTLLTPKPLHQLAPGDVALFTMNDNPQHLAIIAHGEQGRLNLIHSYAQARKVVEHELDEHWWQSVVSGFAIK